MLGCEPCGEGPSGCAKKASSGGAVHALLLRLCTDLPLQYSHHGARVVQGEYLLDGVVTH